MQDGKVSHRVGIVLDTHVFFMTIHITEEYPTINHYCTRAL